VTGRYSEDVKRRAVADVARRVQATATADTGVHPWTANRRAHGHAIESVANGLGVRDSTVREWIRRYGPPADPVTPTTADLVPVTDAERLLRTFYRSRSTFLYARHDLVAADTCPDAANLAPVHAGVTAAASRGFTLRPPPVTVVARLPIRTGYDGSSLRFDFITDLVLAVTTAEQVAGDCLLYLVADDHRPHGSDRANPWRQHTDAAQRVARRVVDQLAARAVTVTIARTDDPDIQAMLDHAVAAHRYGLKRHLVHRNPRTAGRQLATPQRIHAVASGIVGFLPSVVSDITARELDPDILIVESLQTAGQARAARLLHADTARRIQYLGHVPVPSLSGTAPMSTAHPDDALQLGDPAAVNHRKIQDLRGPARRHWQHLWQLHRTASGSGADSDLSAMVDAYHELAAR
jgi:hypothetical protein